ncbi:MAG TPA: ABC transporter substrate-binding protein [Alphaproteobacteria bacterium]|jgi:iron(III) transport system substrate-binding protein
MTSGIAKWVLRAAGCLGLVSAVCLAMPVAVRAADDAEPFFASLESLSPADREAKLLEGAKKEGSVVWYTTDSPQSTQIMVKAFMKKYPSVKAEYIRGKSREIADRIMTEARSGRNLFDIAKTSTETVDVYPEGTFATYKSPVMDDLPATMKGKNWASIFTFVRALGYNSNMLKPADLPKTWEDLLDPKWKGKILFDESSVPEVNALYARLGKDKASDYLDRLGSSGNLRILTGRNTISQMLTAGEAPLAVTVYPYDVESLKRKGAPIDWALLDINPGLLQPLSIARKPAHPYAAALMYDYLLSKEGQEVYAEMGRTPANPKAAVKNEREKAAVQDPRVIFENLEGGGAPFEVTTQMLDEKILKRSLQR